ncbi:MAG: Tad domain-containing protein [Vibrio sp.]
MTLQINMNRTKKKQKGLTLVLVTMLMSVVLLFSSLAIDINHAFVNKTKLQNAVDSAALAGATEINKSFFNKNIITQDSVKSVIYKQLNAIIPVNQKLITIQYFKDPINTDDVKLQVDVEKYPYVRVKVNELDLDSYVIQLFDVDKQVSASALAGPKFSETNQLCTDELPIRACYKQNSNNLLAREKQVFLYNDPFSGES